MSLAIQEKLEESVWTVALDGRLDSQSAPQLEDLVHEKAGQFTEVCFDFEKLAYISSAGLRILLIVRKSVESKEKLVVKNASAEIVEILDMTKFTDYLTLA